jgi:hypothetical protein
MTSRRLRAPRDDSAVLALPPLAQAAELTLANARRLAARTVDVQGRSFDVLRNQARRELLQLSSAYLREIGLDAPGDPNADLSQLPLIVGGHQPELFHAGVWIKNFAVGALANQCGGVPIHLIVDNDLPKAVGIRVPTLATGTLRNEFVEFDDLQPEVPFEQWRCHNTALFHSFEQRVLTRLGRLVEKPLLLEHWPIACRQLERDARIGRAFSAGRSHVERSWGLKAWEVPLSSICASDTFRWFFSHLLAHLPRFHRLHNQALSQHRAANHIRSRNHPVPDLATDGEWYEAPAWVWHVDRPRRKPLLVRQRNGITSLRIASDSTLSADLKLSESSDACCAVEALRGLEESGWRIRTRALTTTMYARLMLGDLFIHGIGGAKYDELGDAIVREFFGFEPPEFLTLSMTVWLGLPDQPATTTDLRVARRTARDLEYNPDRHLENADDPQGHEWVARKRAAIEAPQDTRSQRVERWRIIHECNARLAPQVAAQREAVASDTKNLEAALRWNNLSHAREFAYVLQNAHHLKHAYEQAVQPLGRWKKP